MALRALHLCSGYGGFELALRSVARVRTVAHVERDAYAATVLVERMAQARLDQAPVWDDIETFDGAAWRGRVDLVTAGFPCQPFSLAGQRRGVDDDRWLWPHIARIVGEVGPRFVVLENVPGVVRHGLPEILDDLAQLGFDAEWSLLSAAAVGATHKRERFWLLAHANSKGLAWFGRQPDNDRNARHDADRCNGPHVGDATSGGRGERQRSATRQRWADGTETAVGFPPCRGDHDGWEAWIAAGGPEPVLRRRTDGPPVGLADALHLGGNGLVPGCAAEAIRRLAERAEWELT